jgi:hypothetical protein
VHEVLSDQSGKGEQAGDAVLQGVGRSVSKKAIRATAI